MTYVTEEEIKADVDRYLANRWQTVWSFFPAAERAFLRWARQFPAVGEDVASQIALTTAKKMVERSEAKLKSPAYLVTAMKWGLLTYLKRNKVPRQFTDFEVEKGWAS